jgi:PAS domain-containing protein
VGRSFAPALILLKSTSFKNNGAKYSTAERFSYSFSPGYGAAAFCFAAAGVGTWEVELDSNKIFLDDCCKAIFGVYKEASISYNDALTYVHPADRNAVTEGIQNALSGINGGKCNIMFHTPSEDGTLSKVHVQGQVYFNNENQVVRFGGIVQNITAPLPTENKQETDKLLQAVFDSSAAGISVLKAIRNADGTIVDFEYRLVNRVTEKINNRTDLVGKRYSEIHSAYAASGIFDDFVQVVETGKSIEKKRHYTGEGFNNWFATIAVKQEDGLVFTFSDITDEILIQKEIEENDIRFRNLIEEAPVATCLVTGKEMKIELVNEIMLSYWGKNKSIIGLPLEKGVPELKGQPFLKILDDVFTTGATHVSKSAPVELEIDGVLSTYYFDFINKAIRNGKGEIYGIIDMAVDVTDEVKAIKNLEVSEARFRNLLHQTPFALALVKGKEFVIELANQKALELWGKSMKT